MNKGKKIELESKNDPCASSCPVGRAAYILDGRWTTRIIRDLLPGKRRYSQLLHSLEGISPKVLAARLRFLEKEEIVRKTIYAEVPPRTEYELTDRGRMLQPIISAMAAFGSATHGPDEGIHHPGRTIEAS